MAMAKTSIALAFAASAAAEDLFSTAPGGCQGMLGDIAAQGRSDAELAAYCRASMPPKLCQDALSGLGQLPWTTGRIASTCEAWKAQWIAAAVMGAPGRDAMDFDSLQATLNGCMAAKAESGLCEKKPGTPMSLNECIDHKQEVYPQQTKKYNDAIQDFYSAVMGTSPATQAPSAKEGGASGGETAGEKGDGQLLEGAADESSGKAEELGPVAAFRGRVLFLLAVPGLAVAALAAGATVLRRLRRSPGSRMARVAGTEEDGEAGFLPEEVQQ
mmetsp:Transcript_743/g.2488  ORF Transcript_743/g.2488 Transcript_743/m.2488 type:complete len:272 (+) Transcript_743:79-894(+)|eukprot:CAMPEP_0204602804 /NCGR_PEP_ID=MMETSP0661-20131031/56873_1 /ASSEMBLY_ACC=CAM_ASM_000606 /TAXON_ID=109239 /ORGANISM="Alexandrium margalefi, Strain AMGDE01CS-322" /LENGTH=271 /DNA_ID=CAMNT_0051613811 /DNA_START=73 /DNA_END=888 /DNA_ORIENTATION=+